MRDKCGDSQTKVFHAGEGSRVLGETGPDFLIIVYRAPEMAAHEPLPLVSQLIGKEQDRQPENCHENKERRDRQVSGTFEIVGEFCDDTDGYEVGADDEDGKGVVDYRVGKIEIEVEHPRTEKRSADHDACQQQRKGVDDLEIGVELMEEHCLAVRVNAHPENPGKAERS